MVIPHTTLQGHRAITGKQATAGQIIITVCRFNNFAGLRFHSPCEVTCSSLTEMKSSLKNKMNTNSYDCLVHCTTHVRVGMLCSSCIYTSYIVSMQYKTNVCISLYMKARWCVYHYNHYYDYYYLYYYYHNYYYKLLSSSLHYFHFQLSEVHTWEWRMKRRNTINASGVREILREQELTSYYRYLRQEFMMLVCSHVCLFVCVCVCVS